MVTRPECVDPGYDGRARGGDHTSGLRRPGNFDENTRKFPVISAEKNPSGLLPVTDKMDYSFVHFVHGETTIFKKTGKFWRLNFR